MSKYTRSAILAFAVGLGLGLIVFASEPRLFCPPNWESGICADDAASNSVLQETGDSDGSLEQEGQEATELVGQARQPSPERALLVVWWTSMVLVAAGVLLGFADILRLSREAADLRLLELGLVESWKEDEGSATTVSAERYVRFKKVQAQDLLIGDWFGAERDRAEGVLAPIGSTTRLLASVLLVLAVIGTFAGMRSALPVLIEQLSHVSNSGRGGVDLRLALTPVADAFGANLVALLGSVSLGIMAFGASRSRDELLLGIETVSDDVLYTGFEVPTTTEDLRRAVETMSQTATAVADTRTSIDSLSGEISRFNTDLRDAIRNLRSSFQSTLQNELSQQMEKSVRRISEEVALITNAVSQTAVAYEGLVNGLKSRDERLAELTKDLRRSTVALQAEFKRETRDLGTQLEASSKSTVEELRSGLHADLAPLVEALGNAGASVRELTGASRSATVELLKSVNDSVGKLSSAEEKLAHELQQTGVVLSSSASSIEEALELLGPMMGRLAELTRQQSDAVDLFRENVKPLVVALGEVVQETRTFSAESRAEFAKLVETSRQTIEAEHAQRQKIAQMLLDGLEKIRASNRETLHAQKEEYRTALDNVVLEMQRAVSAGKDESRAILEAFNEAADRILRQFSVSGSTVDLSQASIDRLTDSLERKSGGRGWFRR